MPELPEVENVKENLKKKIVKKTITNINISYPKVIAYPEINIFTNKIINQKILDINRRGKWLMFELNDYYLLSHLRMEGRYYIKNIKEALNNHQLITFILDNSIELRYIDTRKFGKMYLIEKDKIYSSKPLNSLGLEPFDNALNIDYLKNIYKNKKIPIKTSLLDQSIIVGIGNIYADEILYLSHINPYKKVCELSDIELNNIINNTKKILKKAIKKGGTTIKTYESSEGVHGNFQDDLLVRGKKICPICNNIIIKDRINGRGTYYCKECQK